MARVEQHLKNFVIVPCDFELSRVCGRISGEREPAGRRMEEFDAWIAATALRHGMLLATNNRKHFEGIDGLGFVPPIARGTGSR
jgi:predicted nucleic acid-binding protein